jgi:hypothetical protein
LIAREPFGSLARSRRYARAGDDSNNGHQPKTSGYRHAKAKS